MLSRERPSFALTRRRLAGMLAASAALTTVAATSAAAPAEPDALLIGLADELDSLDARGKALGALYPRADYADIPGTDAIEARRWAVLEALATTPATSLQGFSAKARALHSHGLQGDIENHGAIADSLAADIIAAAAAA